MYSSISCRILGAGSSDETPLFFSSQHGVISLTLNKPQSNPDTTSSPALLETSKSKLCESLNVSVSAAGLENLTMSESLTDQLKAAFLLHCKRSNNQAEAIVEIDRCIRAIDTSNVISVVGDAGVGKRFIISIACKKRNLQLIKATPQDLTKILATCGNSAAIQISMSGWGSKWRRYFLEMIRIIKTRPKLTIFFILSTNAFDDRTLEAIFSVLRTSTEIIGLPRWSKGDLRSCKLSDVDTEIGDVKIVMEWLINIHMEILQLCQKENVIRPTISVFKICHRLCIRQISLSKAALDERIKILSQVFKQYHQFEDDLGLLKTREACAYDIHKIST